MLFGLLLGMTYAGKSKEVCSLLDSKKKHTWAVLRANPLGRHF